MRFSPLTDPAQGDELAQSYTTGGNLAWRIVDAVSGRSAGVAALKLGSHEDTRRSVSLFLARDAWGQGYGAAAVHALQARAVELRLFHTGGIHCGRKRRLPPSGREMRLHTG